MSDSSLSDWLLSSDSEQEAEDVSDDQDEEDFIDFSQIPFELQCAIVEKFKPRTFITFDESSRLGHSISWSKLHWIKFSTDILYVEETRMQLKVADDIFFDDRFFIPYEDTFGSPFRMKTNRIYTEGHISRNRLQEVTALLEQCNTTTIGLGLYGNVSFEPADLEKIITITRPYMFWCDEYLSRQCLQHPCLQTLREIEVNDTGCTDDELVCLTASHLSLRGNITLRGVRHFLKQWRKNERKIDLLQLHFDKAQSSSDIELNLEGVDANPVWTPALHSDSILAPLPRENVYHMRHNEHIYSLWKPEKLKHGLLIQLKSTYLHTETTRDEAEYLLRNLDDDDYYKVKKECRMCRTQFCEHRNPINVEEI